MRASELQLQLMTEARSFARKVGFLRPLAVFKANVMRKLGRGYEESFDKALHANIRPGDVVWDVGANVGLYTVKFSEWVGESGQVHAFEPVPSCFKMIEDATRGVGNVHLNPFALGDIDGELQMNEAEDPLGATHSFSDHNASGKVLAVQVKKGDTLIADRNLRTPNVLKIDVEGFEEEVLLGLRKTLLDSRCRAVLIEVHFGILDKRGKRQAPSAMSKQLQDAGFAISWADASHLVATKPT